MLCSCCREDAIIKLFNVKLKLNIVILIYVATMLLTLANLDGEESFEASMLGSAGEVVQEKICDDELIIIKE